MDWLVQLEQGALGIVVFSFVLYIKRTADVKTVNFFLAKQPLIDPSRIYHQACGLGLMIVGVPVRLIYHTSFIGG